MSERGRAEITQVIHRGLKPSNILVADVDGKPQPKILKLRGNS